MCNKLETNELRMWAVVPEEGFLDDVLAIFKTEGEAEHWRAVLLGTEMYGLCVVPVYAQLGLVTDEEEQDD
jgi:hypothetical protein